MGSTMGNDDEFDTITSILAGRGATAGCRLRVFLRRIPRGIRPAGGGRANLERSWSASRRGSGRTSPDAYAESIHAGMRSVPSEPRAAVGAALVCPRDGATLTARSIGGGSFGLGYSRRREWLICPACRRSVLFDRKRGNEDLDGGVSRPWLCRSTAVD